jgi:hypothetical protein
MRHQISQKDNSAEGLKDQNDRQKIIISELKASLNKLNDLLQECE